MHLPPSDVIDRSVVKSYLPQTVVALLAEGNHTWPGRGWDSQSDFNREFLTGLDATDELGIVVARAQTEAEARELAMKLEPHCLSALAERVAAPTLRTTVGLPPAREDDFEDDAAIAPSLSERNAPHNPAPVYSVLIHAPADAPPMNTSERGHWVVTWFAEGCKAKIVRYLGKGYPAGFGVKTGRYTWPDRGWEREEHFHCHFGIAIRDGPCGVVARGQSYVEALFLTKRLRGMGLTVSLSSNDAQTVTKYGLTAYPDESSADMAWNHAERMLIGGSGGREAAERAYEEAVGGLGLPSLEEMARQVASGRSVESMAAEAAAAAVAAGRTPADFAGLLQGLPGLLARARVGNGGGRGKKNKSSGTKRDVLDKLPKIIVEEGMMTDKGEPIPACCVCTDEIVVGDEITCLPCGHYSHRGVEDEAAGVNRAGVHVRKGKDSSLFYCSRWLGKEKIPGSDGQCGPNDGPQCEDCKGYSLANNPPPVPEAEKGDAQKMEGGQLRLKSECCPGVLEWLKTHHDCPVCRHELEADVSPDDDEKRQSSSWTCPLCRTINVSSRQSCRCGCRRHVFDIAEDLCGNAFRDAETLFFKCIDFAKRKKSSDASSNFGQEEEALLREVKTLLASPEIADAVEHGWEIVAGIESLLKSALQGEVLRFHPGDVDTNSRGVVAVFFNRIREHVDTAAQAAGQSTDLVFETPDVGCPLCPICNEGVVGEDCGTCNVSKNGIELSKRLEKVLFKKVNDLFFRIVLSPSPSLFRGEVDRLLEGEELNRLEKGGWVLKFGISSLLRAALNGEKDFKFDGGLSMDSNSRGVLAVLFNLIRNELSKNSAALSLGINVEKPYVLPNEALEMVTFRYPLREHTRSFLNSQPELWRRLSALIVSGGPDQEWVSFLL